MLLDYCIKDLYFFRFILLQIASGLIVIEMVKLQQQIKKSRKERQARQKREIQQLKTSLPNTNISITSFSTLIFILTDTSCFVWVLCSTYNGNKNNSNNETSSMVTLVHICPQNHDTFHILVKCVYIKILYHRTTTFYTIITTCTNALSNLSQII